MRARHEVQPTGPAQGASAGRERDRPTVLVIDDEASIRALLQVLLTDEDYHVRTAGDGPAGLRAAADHTPDCVLLDIMMPGMDGYAVLKELRSGPMGRHLTIVMLTAADDDEHAWAAWRGGVDYFLGKPFDLQMLLPYLKTRFGNFAAGDLHTTPGRTPHAPAMHP